jgi:hypothetical protein
MVQARHLGRFVLSCGCFLKATMSLQAKHQRVASNQIAEEAVDACQGHVAVPEHVGGSMCGNPCGEDQNHVVLAIDLPMHLIPFSMTV